MSLNPNLTLAFAGGILVGVITMAAAKTLATLALPVGVVIIAGVVYWKRKKRNNP